MTKAPLVLLVEFAVLVTLADPAPLVLILIPTLVSEPCADNIGEPPVVLPVTCK